MGLYIVGTKSFWVILIVVFLRYLILASIAFTIFYLVFKKTWWFKKIQFKFPARADYAREIMYSVFTSVIFAGIGYAVFLTPISKFTKAYYSVDEYGWWYLTASVLVTIILHDTYFYWMHRAMHHQLVYRWVHRVHHLSTNPSPWAAMAFHPIEAVFEAGIIVLVAFLYPIHPLAIGIFLLFMMSYNVYGHLGYELYPSGFSRSKIGRWINTSVNHNLHHEHFIGNYGLYFLYWDRWMGTIRPDYDLRYTEVKTRKNPDNPKIL